MPFIPRLAYRGQQRCLCFINCEIYDKTLLAALPVRPTLMVGGRLSPRLLVVSPVLEEEKEEEEDIDA